MESQSETTQTVSALKLSVLKTGDYDLWSMRMEQYLTHTDYSLWEVIDGDAPSIVSASAGTEGLIPPKTVEQKLARKNELKAKSTLLLAIPDEHLLKFHGIKDAKTLWEEDVNLKLLRSLPSAWNNIALIMKNKSDLDTLSMDDLYNNLKVYESEIKGQSSSSLNSQNVAFVSSENTSSTNEGVNTAHDVSTANNEDLEHIDTNDLEEMNLKWQVAMLTLRVKRFLKKTRRNLNFKGKEIVGFDKTKIECGYDWSFQAEEGIINFALMAYTSQGYQLELESLEARIVGHEKNEVVYEEDIAFFKYDVQVKDISIKDLKNQLEEALKEKDDLKLKLEKFEESSKNLTKLINSQISAKDKVGLGYDSQMNESEVCMTRSSTNELYIPYKDPEQEFRSSKKHFKSLSLDELRSSNFNLLSVSLKIQEGNALFGFQDLCLRQELLEYMGVHDNDASESSQPSWGKISKLEYKFQDKENSEDIFSFGSAMEDFICVVFVPDRNIVLDLEKEKDVQAMEILRLKKRVKRLERQRKSSTSQLRRRKYRQVESSDEEDASKQGRKNDKTNPMLHESDFDGFGNETVDATTTGVSTTSAPVPTGGVAINTVEPRTPPTTTTVFNDEDMTMAMA
ncbi:hypothetical protein Tco_0971414 [Tanacetum coccineum]